MSSMNLAQSCLCTRDPGTRLRVTPLGPQTSLPLSDIRCRRITLPTHYSLPTLLPTRRPSLTHLPRLQHLITKQQITRNPRRARDSIPQHSERIIYTFLYGIHCVAESEVEACDVAFCVFVLEGRNYKG